MNLSPSWNLIQSPRGRRRNGPARPRAHRRGVQVRRGPAGAPRHGERQRRGQSRRHHRRRGPAVVRSPAGESVIPAAASAAEPVTGPERGAGIAPRDEAADHHRRDATPSGCHGDPRETETGGSQCPRLIDSQAASHPRAAKRTNNDERRSGYRSRGTSTPGADDRPAAPTTLRDARADLDGARP
jgi:hypothetical protein